MADDTTCPVVFDNGARCKRPVKYRARIGDGMWCNSCYNWSRNNGWDDPTGRPTQRSNGAVRRMLQHAARTETDDCLILDGYRHRPHIQFNGTWMNASRAVWIIRYGDPGAEYVLHTCHRGTEGCINIRHLKLGDHDQNMKDMFAAGGGRWPPSTTDDQPPRRLAPAVNITRPTKTCTVTFDGGKPCTRICYTSKWCHACYEWSRTNDGRDPMGRRPRRPNGQLVKELTEIAYGSTDECVFLDGFKGRPALRFRGVGMDASRAVWMIRRGDPGGAYVLHTCHRGEDGCVNIRHLYLGDHAQNARDMVESGRSARGPRHRAAKLTNEEVYVIRSNYVRGAGRHRKGNAAKLAANFGVSQSTIRDVVARRSWAWLERG